MDTSAIEKNGKIFLLAYDQGFEHGPSQDFNENNYHPNQIFKIAIGGNASCVAMSYGLSKRYYDKSMRKQIPLILKLNSKTKLFSENTVSTAYSDVEDAVRLGATGVGYTIFPGQKDEHIGFKEFSEIRKAAEKAGLITVLWAYARGPEIAKAAESEGVDQFDDEVIGYAVRVASELGADVAKVKYTGNPESFSWAKKMGAGIKLIASGTDNFGDNYLDAVGDMIRSGADGIAVGRKVWQHEDAENFASKVAAKIYNS